MRPVNQRESGYGGAGQNVNRSIQKGLYGVTGHDRLQTFASSKANVLVYVLTFASMFASASASSKANVLVYDFTPDSTLAFTIVSAPSKGNALAYAFAFAFIIFTSAFAVALDFQRQASPPTQSLTTVTPRRERGCRSRRAAPMNNASVLC